MAVDSINPFGEIIAAGVDFTTVIALLPTLVCEGDNAIHLDVLDSAPDFADVRHAVNAWVATKNPRDLRDRTCVAYLIAPDIVEAVVHSADLQFVFHGTINRSAAHVTWKAIPAPSP